MSSSLFFGIILLCLSAALLGVEGRGCQIKVGATGQPVDRLRARSSPARLLAFSKTLVCHKPAESNCTRGCEMTTKIPKRGGVQALIFVCTCKGAVVGDPKFQGFDGSVFWFHGKKDRSWCISSDKNLHINAYFSGKAAPEVILQNSAAKVQQQPHDLTWVQKLAFLFGKHILIVEAIQEAGFSKDIDHLTVSLNGETVDLPAFVRSAHPPAASWVNKDGSSHAVKLTRVNTKNQMRLEIEGLLSVFIKVVPTKKDVWTAANSFAHIDTEFTFLHPTSAIDGVLGRTLKMPEEQDATADSERGSARPYILKNIDDYSTSDLTTPDCKVAQFDAEVLVDSIELQGAEVELSRITCVGRSGALGLACR
eukprot:TRINITY_DN23664_c0_g1_i1.p1 TRINITY_DN23664_c0_g1~~TRINITY_DN23664_c0_g1_i1.p1  ORF type:complete len:366 (+),score=51.98 TRINITY_DN23664_c0_g1_i1:105-1202(+)